VTDVEAADFVERFEKWWAAPDPAVLGGLLAPDVVLKQPIVAHTFDLAGAERSFTRILAAIPDLGVTVHHWAVQGEVIIIEFTLAGTLGGRPFSWANVDRFTVNAAGLATERVNYHDSLGLILKILARPLGWPRFLRSGVLRRS
jgi:SnoaL-like domain